MARGRWLDNTLSKQKGRCYYCECVMDTRKIKPGSTPAPNAMTEEHLLPTKHGGTNSKQNRVLACYRCNNGRGSQIDWKPTHAKVAS